MKSRMKMLNAVKYVGGSVLTCGIILVLFGFLVSDYIIFIPIGIGTVVGAVFIFLMGVFLVATDEILAKIGDQEEMALIVEKERL